MNSDRELYNEENEKISEREVVGLETTIREFLKIVGHKEKGGILPLGIYLNLKLIGEYVNTLGDLKKLAESADGFGRLKNGVFFNNGYGLPHTTMNRFGKKKLEFFNNILSEYKIEPIQWIIRRYKPWERRKERGELWWENLTI